jgi:glutaredoxin-like YruB-family protein
MDTKVTVYSATWCAFCHQAKQYFDKIGVKYTDKDVESDPSIAQESIKLSGQTGIPVINIDGTIIIGFDRPKIDATLRDKNLVK